MKTIQAYEYKDLSDEMKQEVRERLIQDKVEFQLEQLWRDVENGITTEDDAYKIIGCSKYYAESTAWFVPSVYYENHKDEVENNIDESLKLMTFNAFGKSI